MSENRDEAVRKRQIHRDAIIGGALDLIHTQGCRVLPSRLHLLDTWKKSAIVAEVGVASGAFSEEIFSRCEPAELHLVDLWEGERYERGLARVKQRLAKGIDDGRVIINQGYSTEKLAGYPDQFFDVVYVDTDHSYKLTLAELRLSKLKVKKGGIIAGHDFCVGNVVAPYVYGVIQAACEFARSEGWAFTYITLEPHGFWSFAMQEIERLR
jgi:predicted O-methyltransferase YrrM